MSDGTSTNNVIPDFDEVVGPKKDKQENKPASTGSSTSTSDGKKPRDPAQYWLNVGVQKNGKLLTLPMGIPLDKLTAKPVPNKESDFQQLRAGEKQLWEQFQKFFSTLKPGEAKTVNFVCEVRRINEAHEVEEETNPYSVGQLSFT